MAVSDYTTLANVKIISGISDSDTSKDALITLLIPIVARHVDNHCHRHFYPIEETRYFDFQGYWKMWLRGDLWSLDDMTCNDGTVLSNAVQRMLFLRPQVGPPYRWVEVNRAIGTGFRYQTTPQDSVAVTGTWGYLDSVTEEAPVEIGHAVAAWINYLILVSEKTGIASETIGDHTKSYTSIMNFLKSGPPNEVSDILSHFIYRDITSPSTDPLQSQADIAPPWYNQLGQFDRTI